MPRLTEQLPAIHRGLHAWYALHGRHDLPWRTTGDPYAIYISEIMLQQTQVKTVLERYYHPFLERFPTLASLAQAPSQQVMKAWEGLGYYTRARNLHAAAKASGGALPAQVEGLLALPGIGRNTAHAVASFGFKLPVPVMEANVKRVLARLFAMTARDDKTLWRHAETLLDRDNPFDYNQAMMDIGALVCTKRQPRCGECPLSGICQGKENPELYPAPKAARHTPIREKNIIVLQDKEGRVLLTPRATRFLGGLYGFHEMDKAKTVLAYNGIFYSLAQATRLGHVTQIYSHFTLQAAIYLIKTLASTPAAHDALWLPLRELSTLPLSRADLKIVSLLAAYREDQP